MNRQTTSFVAITVVIALASFGAGWKVASDQGRDLGEAAIRVQALTKANQVDGAVSALSMMQTGNVAGVKQHFELQISSGLTVLYAFGDRVTGAESALVQDAIQRGEEYAQQHNLKVVKPPQ